MQSEQKCGIAQVPYDCLKFVLNNPDIVTSLCNTPLKLRRVEHDNFTGKITHLKFSVEIFEDEEESLHEVEYVLSVEMPFTIGRCTARATFSVEKVKDDATILSYEFNMKPSRLFMPIILRIYKRTHSYMHNNIIKFIEKAAGYIDKKSTLLEEKLCPAQLSRVTEFIQNRTYNPETTTEDANNFDIDTPDERTWKVELDELIKIHSQIKVEAVELKRELDCLQNQQQASAALIYARRMLEIVVEQLCESVLKRDRGREDLSKLIDKLGKHKGAVPENIWTSMKNLNSIGNYGAHPKYFDERQVRSALIELCTVLEWHFAENTADKFPRLISDDVA